MMDAEPDLSTECEIVWSKVKVKNKKDILLCSFYMPHRNMNDITKLNDSLNKLSEHSKDKTIILCGDFNCPDIDWPNNTVKKGAAERDVQQALLDLSIDHGLTQIHEQPTRLDNILDLVFTNNPSLVKTSTSVPGISDHSMVITDLNILPQVIKQKPRKTYIYSKADWANIQQDSDRLSDTITRLDPSTPVEALWNSFKTGISDIMDKHIPSKMCKNRKSLPWFNKTLLRMTKRKARLYKHAKSSHQWQTYNEFQECKRAFKKAEIDHINSTI